jgi:hypothetical protein
MGGGVGLGVAVHFLHIGKTGGTALKHAIHQSGDPMTTVYGRLVLHRHPYFLTDVPWDDFVFFCIRDPIGRFLSGFYSRQRQGQPRRYSKWTPAEEVAFTRFRTPQALAGALADEHHPHHPEAVHAMTGVQHIKDRLARWLISPRFLTKRRSQVVFIARQETLNEEWPKMKSVVGLPPDAELPVDPTVAHRGRTTDDRVFSEDEARALRDWYAGDYELLEYCETVRRERGWAAG